MKRTFLVLCLAAVMLLGLASMAQAADCWHEVLCTADTTCIYCGATVTDAYVYHANVSSASNDETSHIDTCLDCGEELGEYPHYAVCDQDTTTCIDCGATGVECNLIHQGNLGMDYDETQHWESCSACGKGDYYDGHWKYCTEDDVCTVCGYAAADLWVSHNCNWMEYTHDENNHWNVCEDCGEKVYVEEHFISCADGACVVCGAADVNGEVSHNFGDDYSFDENNHWNECKDCGEKVWLEEHFTVCNPGGPCHVCGQTGDFLNIHLMANLVMEYDESKHWEMCVKCDELAYEGEHYLLCTDIPGICSFCGYADASLVPEHYLDDATTKFDNKNHWGTCMDCGKTVTEPHTFFNDSCWCGATGLNKVYYVNNTACSFGPRFRDQENAVTDKWFMYTPVDLSQDGTQTFDLIASNVYKIGTVAVTVKEGKLTITYSLVSDEIKVSSEFLTVIPALENVTTVDQEAFTAYAFGEEIDMKAVLGDSTTALIYICNVVDYNTGIKGVEVM